MIENELKYVLDGDPLKLLNKFSSLRGSEVFDFEQGYLDKNSRIRSSVNRTTNEANYEFTYKAIINGKQIEIETPIQKEDFDPLWTRVGRSLTKTRVKVPSDSYVWEIDFFYTTKGRERVYHFVMAEVEMPEDQVKPDVVPDFITDHLLYEVPLEDHRFKSINLTKSEAARALLQGLRDVKHQA